MWRAKWGYVPVQGPTKKGQLPGIDFDPYFPEGADINAEGHYIFGDVIWVRCPLLTEVNRILENEKVSTRGGSDRLRAFNTEMMQSGANIPMDILKQISDVF
jgi:hypothetical protein